MIANKFSFAPFGEPGRVISSVLFLTPATGLDMSAKGVISREAANMPWTSPSACLCIKGVMASGVWSLVAKPVPPVVMMRFIYSPSSHSLITCFCIKRMSSGRMILCSNIHWSPPLVENISKNMCRFVGGGISICCVWYDKHRCFQFGVSHGSWPED